MTLDAARFPIGRARVRDGAGGFPLLLVHGWPETKRIWWRNVTPLAAAGFEVIVPDLRGFGDSAVAPDGAYDLAAHARDIHAPVHDRLGHSRCVAPAVTSEAPSCRISGCASGRWARLFPRHSIAASFFVAARTRRAGDGRVKYVQLRRRCP